VELEAVIGDLLGEIHSTADICDCMAEAVLHDPLTDMNWRLLASLPVRSVIGPAHEVFGEEPLRFTHSLVH
jgi:hypothetical protein